jgi:cytoskeletal protein RodZ
MPIVVAILGIIMVGLAVAFFLVPAPDKTPVANTSELTVSEQIETEQTVSEDTTSIENEPSQTSNEPSAEEKQYSAEATYQTPDRAPHNIAVTLNIKDGVVIDANVVYEEGVIEKQTGYQKRFEGVYKAEVIGKSISEIALSRVGGASLTSQAFNEAVAKIKAEQA